MKNKLLAYMKSKPHEYADSTSKFWDDEHISQYMLEAHLNPDIDSASRQHTFIKKSANWIAEITKNPQGKKLLDLGCGAGLYAENFHALGFEVTGIDFAKRSINYATEQAAIKDLPIEYHYQNYLEMQYENKFDVATLIFCDFGVLSPDNRAILLENIKRALKPDGILILDVFTYRQYDDFIENSRVEYAEEGFWNNSPYICIQNDYIYEEHNTYLEQYLIITDTDCHRYNIWNKAFDKDTIGEELKLAGFSDFQFYGNVCGETQLVDSKTLCIVAHNR